MITESTARTERYTVWNRHVQFISFDAGYLERWAAGDPAVEEHFNEYFGELIFIKLRSRQYSRSTIDDIRQETFLRVFQALRREGIRQPERIGAFVSTTCNHVVMEFTRAGSRINNRGVASLDSAQPDRFPLGNPQSEARTQQDLCAGNQAPLRSHSRHAHKLDGAAACPSCWQVP